MQKPDYIPPGYRRIRIVGGLSELFNTRFGGKDEVNCVLYPRPLAADFNALAQHLSETSYIRDFSAVHGAAYPYFDSARLRHFRHSMKPDAAAAANIILEDLDTAAGQLMRAELRLIRPDEYPAVLEQWHHDVVSSFNSMAGRLMCCYNAPVTEGARNEDAIPVTYDSPMEPANHYALRDDAEIFRFPAGAMWRQLATPYLKDVAPPYIHRAPGMQPDGTPRLLLVASC